MMPISEPILLEWGKKPRKSDKHVPLLFLNPETRDVVKYGTQLSDAEFEGSQIGWLVGSNNLLVETARAYSIKLGPEYGQFLEVGLRWAQQLDGKLRERTEEQFMALSKGLETALVNGVLAARKQRRDAGLESLLEATDGMPADDLARLSGYVAELKHKPVATHEGRREGFSDDSISKRLSGIRNDQTLDNQFVQNSKLVVPELRADYVRTVEVTELHGSLHYSLHEQAEDIRKWVADLGVENGRLYLKVLHNLMTHFGEKYENAYSYVKALREEGQMANAAGKLAAHKRMEEGERSVRGISHPWQFYNELNESLGPLDPEGWNLELSVLSATQDAGLWLLPYDAKIIVEDVGKKVGPASVKSALQSAVEALKKGHEAFFDVVEANGVPDYVRSGYVTAASPKAAKT